MTDQQILTLAIAIVFACCAVIYTNSRITDTKETLRAELSLLRAEMKAGFENLQSILRVHELEHHR